MKVDKVDKADRLVDWLLGPKGFATAGALLLGEILYIGGYLEPHPKPISSHQIEWSIKENDQNQLLVQFKDVFNAINFLLTSNVGQTDMYNESKKRMDAILRSNPELANVIARTGVDIAKEDSKFRGNKHPYARIRNIRSRKEYVQSHSILGEVAERVKDKASISIGELRSIVDEEVVRYKKN